MSIHLLYRQETQSHSIRFGRKSCRLCWQITLYKKAKKSPSCSEIISSIISWVSRHNKKVIWPFGLCIYLYILLLGMLHNIFLAKQIMSTLRDEGDVIWVGVTLIILWVNFSLFRLMQKLYQQLDWSGAFLPLYLQFS